LTLGQTARRFRDDRLNQWLADVFQLIPFLRHMAMLPKVQAKKATNDYFLKLA
jgi:hypothetical protein